MINNQKITQAFGTPLRKGIAIGATSVVAATGLLGVGAMSATAASPLPTPNATHSSAAAHSHRTVTSLLEQVRTELFQGQINGSQAQALAARIVNDNAIFSVLPANLQSDLTALKNAPAADAVAQAQQIKTTALSGGYGTQVESLASALQTSAALPVSKSLIDEIRNDLAANPTPGGAGAQIAKTLAEHPQLMSKLPANLQSDVTTLKSAPVSEETQQALGIATRAVSGDYGQQVQTLTQQLVSLTGPSTM